MADYEFLENYKYVIEFAHQDIDPGPSKAFIVTNRNNPMYSKYYDLGFGERPKEELYDIRKDPDQLNNLSENVEYAKIRAQLSAQLMEVLRNTNDPRLKDEFDFPPYVEKQ